MEEKFGKTARVLYIVFYSIIIPVCLLFFVGIGALLIATSPDLLIMGVFLIVLGVGVGGASIGWLVYFIKMPQFVITYKDGKLNFRNKVECTPVELDSYQQKGFNLDGAIFGFGKLLITVKGQSYKFRYVYNVNEVIQRLYTIKLEYTMQQEIARRNAEAAQKVESGDDTVENNG